MRNQTDDLLEGIPQSLWDTPMASLDGQTPRQAAKHISASGCRACWFNLKDLREGKAP